jgi:ERCC4-type nuclease
MIEGDVNKMNRFKDNKMEKLTMYSAMFSLNYFKGFSVMRTLSLEESAIFICNTANKLSKTETSGKKPYYENNKNVSKISNDTSSEVEIQEGGDTENTNVEKDNEQSEKDYVNVVKKVKKDNITPENIGEIMLCQIPGISSVSALAIMDKFKTIPNLIHEVEKNEDCLKDISYVNVKGQTRKINKTSLINIVKYLFEKIIV